MALYDFYYSAKQERCLNIIRGHVTTINGLVYTEMIIAGKKPMTSHVDDLVKIATEDDSKVVIKQKY